MSTEYNLNDGRDVTLVVEEKYGHAVVTVRNKFHFTKKIQFPTESVDDFISRVTSDAKHLPDLDVSEWVSSFLTAHQHN